MTVGKLVRKQDPTTTDIYDAVIEAHQCLDQQGRQQTRDRRAGQRRDKALTKALEAVTEKLARLGDTAQAMDKRLARVEGFQTAIGAQVGVARTADPVSCPIPDQADAEVMAEPPIATQLHGKPIGLWRPGRALWAFAVAGAAGAGAYKIIWEVILAIHKALLDIA